MLRIRRRTEKGFVELKRTERERERESGNERGGRRREVWSFQKREQQWWRLDVCFVVIVIVIVSTAYVKETIKGHCTRG